MKIGFDLDGIFVDKPPFVPKSFIEWLYRKHDHTLRYRIPSKPEQLIRKISHVSIFRPPIRNNIQVIQQKPLKSKHAFYLISGRFGFLQKETGVILKKYKLNEVFYAVLLNANNEQPHIFKQKVLKKLHIDVYVDDDLPLIKFLATKHRHIRFFWFNKKDKIVRGKNIVSITSLSEVFKK